jgi:exodeoxyribonuclease V alpha subunit
LAGLVERVTFQSPDNGFCVLRIKARGQRELTTLVGHAATVTTGEFVQMSGAWVKAASRQQLRASFLKAMPTTTFGGIERYLASGLILGIGPVYATRLVRVFGETRFDFVRAAARASTADASATMMGLRHPQDQGSLSGPGRLESRHVAAQDHPC